MSLARDVTNEYYRSTAQRGHRPTLEHYRDSASGLYRRFSRWLPATPEARCLDLACGCGEFLFMLEEHGFRSTAGVDLCKEQVDMARQFVRGDLFQRDVVEFLCAQPPASYDFVTALNLLEHLPKTQSLDFLREIRRVLSPGGTLVLMVPNALSPFGASTRYWDVTHEISFTPNNFHQLAPLAGFSSNVEFRECGPVPHGLKSGVRYIAWQGLRLAIAVWLLVEVATTRSGVYTMDMLVRLTRED